MLSTRIEREREFRNSGSRHDSTTKHKSNQQDPYASARQQARTGYMVHSGGLRDVAALFANHQAKLDLVVELGAARRHLRARVTMHKRIARGWAA
jgi:hypothetical protein